MMVGTSSKMAGVDVDASLAHGESRRAACVARCASCWRSLCRSLGVDEAPARTWWGVLEEEYGAAGRYYHTLEHIDALLRLADRHALDDGAAVRLAIFFHDVVYDARNGGGGANERESADAFVAFAEEAATGLSDARRDKVRDWIARTASHRVGENAESDERLFMDFDMSILASDRSAYLRYAANVRKEYGHVSGAAWRVGRCKFLTATIDAGAPVFASPQFAAKEANARANARAERDALLIELVLGAGAALAAVAAAAAAAYYRPGS